MICLIQLDNKKIIPFLVNFLTGKPKIRRKAIKALGKIGTIDEVLPLLDVLQKYPEHTAETIIALGKIGDQRVLETLEPFLQNEYPKIKMIAHKAMLQIQERIKCLRGS